MAAFILKRCADEKKRVPRAFLPLCFTFTYSRYIDKENKVKWGGGGLFLFASNICIKNGLPTLIIRIGTN